MAKVRGRNALSMTEMQVNETPKEKVYVAMDKIPLKHFNRDTDGPSITITDPKSKMPTSYWPLKKLWFDAKYYARYLKKRRIVNPETGERITLAY